MIRVNHNLGANTHIIIVAAGRGSRFGSELPKQFCMLGECPVLMHTVKNLARALPAAKMAIVLNADYIEYWTRVCAQYDFPSPILVEGGETRWESVKNAIEALDPADQDVVLVHDGVRPVVETAMVERIVNALSLSDAAIPVVPVTDSLRRLERNGDSRMEDRSKLVAVQTPQAFRAGAIKQAYQRPYQPDFTDDASVYEAAGHGCPALVEGSAINIKITNPRDIDVAALFMGIK